MNEEAFDATALRERRSALRAWSDAKDRRGKYRKAFVRSMRASQRHWRIRLAAGMARVFTMDGQVITLPRTA